MLFTKLWQQYSGTAIPIYLACYFINENLTSNTDISTLVANGFNPTNYSNIIITQTLTIDASFLFNNCNIILGPDAKINVMNNATLTLNACVLRGSLDCSQM